jgi:hypothetical protein
MMADLNVHADHLGRGDAEQVAGLAGEGALHQHAVVLSIHRNNLNLALLHGHVTHLPGLLGARVDAARRGTGASGTVLAVRLRAVSHQTTLVSMALDATLESLSDASALHVNKVALAEHGRPIKLLTRLEAVHGLHPELAEMAQSGGTGLGKMAKLGLCHVLLLGQRVAHLHRTVAVALLGLHHGHDVAVVHGDDGDGHYLAVLREHLRHTRLVAEDAHASLESVGAHHQGAAGTGPRGEGRAGEGGGRAEGGFLMGFTFYQQQ